MKGIIFEDIGTGERIHSYDDLHLVLLEGKEIGSPDVKKMKIDVQGADSSLDYTDFWGEPKYEDVTHKFPFAAIVPSTQFLSLYSTIKNALHGKKKRIILDDDPLHYFLGRVEVQPFSSSKNIGYVDIECDCEPYKYKLAKTVVSKAVSGTVNIVLTNSRKRAVPEVKIESAGGLHIVYQESLIWDLGSGSFTLPELELVEGENVVTVTGTGNITFTWQEGGL